MNSKFPALLDSNTPVLVGFSGGLDSSVLLHWLATSPAQRAHGLSALYVHHGLHPDADAWSQHCAAACAALGVPLTVVRVQVMRDAGEGLEAAARHARHTAFAEHLQPGQRLAVAHHRDDQAETFLLRALRASGPDGLASMAAQRPFAAGTLWRPLLDVPRDALLSYARQHGLSWIEDPSNEHLEHDRNFLRHRILPLLRERWPHAAAALARSAALSGEAADLLSAGDDAALDTLLGPHGALDLDGLRGQPAPLRARLLRRWVARHHAPALPAQGVTALEAELAHHAADRAMRFAWRDVEIRRWRQHLYLLRPTPAWPPGWQTSWDGATPLALPDGATLTLHATSQSLRFDRPLHVRARHGGERIVLPGRMHSHSLKHLLQDADMPPWQRMSLPLLCDADNVLAAGDGIVSAELRDWLDAHAAWLEWRFVGRV
jgi:tRNA(Ile)-lysidine synthase